ncbi:glycosyl transferase family protein [Trinickia caryophylli]|uniref:Adsorption protein B n=1 Tax=Trinickia caryophylli TaxID=28094 RepID=A0A1X7F2D6_TRICW|nr:glycosyl transferase family protein [Trinickia caryophylli]PMS10378.1 type II secretion system protein E [Trinickia caryophylli]TRX20365.1 glycosyl transferase family protein [Trinickia caryophylli]WQE13638.1 glycosyl transferase family protein [Trinickia caryophylli]SMF44656.1 adsorption protein B [Trinickia caryophylli]GLU34499.1 bacteriophage N4 adsorption protein B [Trinickia caryophylli]
MDLAALQWYGGYAMSRYYSGLETMAGVVAVLIFVSSLDDLFIDLWFWSREAYRRFTVKRRHKPLTAEQLHVRAEQPIAIMVPAWLEHDVIAAMLEDLVRVLDYRNYVVFVGTYRNDARTIAEVERMRRRYRQLCRIEVPHDGPTCKADCLNWVVQGILKYERESEIEFAGVVLHDSEDVLHPLELKFFNYLLPRKDMIQLPVASLERHWFELVAGTYMDEFAEWHAKDLVVRESLAGTVPSAGVGTCFSRRALAALIGETGNQPFNTESLTEDYDVGNRLGTMGMQSIFARFPVTFSTRRKSWFGLGPEREFTLTMPLCVREFFPDTLRTAYRQRARWTLGIGMQGWRQTGFSGSLANRYLLMRDRKGVVTSFIGMLAYLLVIQFVAFELAQALGLTPAFPASPLADAHWFQWLLWANGCALALRAAQRVYFVTRLYGWEHGLLCLPRMIIANFVNFMAVARAWRLFAVHLVTGKRLAWDKTMHDFPSADGLTERRQRLGELLLSWQAIDASQLESALNEGYAREAPLGRVLMAKGWLDEETLAEAIAFQADLPRGALDLSALDRHAARLPLDTVVRYRVLPGGEGPAGHAIVLAASPVGDAAIASLETQLGQPVALHVVREGEIAAGLRHLRGGVAVRTSDAHGSGAPEAGAGGRGVPLIGDMLIEHGYVKRHAFDAALTDYRPDRHGRIGEYMVARGVISREALSHVIQEQRRLSGLPAAI